jgi:hypothetical protein
MASVIAFSTMNLRAFGIGDVYAPALIRPMGRPANDNEPPEPPPAVSARAAMGSHANNRFDQPSCATGSTAEVGALWQGAEATWIEDGSVGRFETAA